MVFRVPTFPALRLTGRTLVQDTDVRDTRSANGRPLPLNRISAIALMASLPVLMLATEIAVILALITAEIYKDPIRI